MKSLHFPPVLTHALGCRMFSSLGEECSMDEGKAKCHVSATAMTERLFFIKCSLDFCKILVNSESSKKVSSFCETVCHFYGQMEFSTYYSAIFCCLEIFFCNNQLHGLTRILI